MIDLHAHSTCSDGTLTPTELANYAAEIGLTTLALTDHDTVSGVSEARVVCQRLGMRFIAGVELEVDSRGGEFHLLGLGLSAAQEETEATLVELKRRRHRRNRGIVDKMRDDGIDVDLQAVASYAGGEVVGRPHFARFLVEKRIAVTVQDAFDRFLGHNQKYYLPIEHLTVAECAQIIRQAGGHTIIAHPLTIGLSLKALEEKLDEWVAAGVEGIEAYHPNAALEDCKALEKIAVRRQLFVTAGSDFHGFHRKDRSLGHTAGGVEIDGRFLDWLDSP